MGTREEPLRQRFCRGVGCGAVFWICRHCDRGHRYCSDRCRRKARRQQLRAANRRHQQSREGRLDHRDRQRAYRERCRRGTVKFSGSVADLADETRHAELPWISIPTRHYQPRRLAVSPLRCELSRCRRSPGPTRHYGVLRSDPAVVPHVRFSIRSPAQASTGPAGRHLAPGRGLRHHPGTAALSLACRRSRW